MTALEAYETDHTFRALVDEWVNERRCPRPLVDRCLELDMPGAAECARWASDPLATPDLPTHERPGRDERRGACGPYPTQALPATFREHQWYWRRVASPEAERETADEIPHPDGVESRYKEVGHRPTVARAILWLLDAWGYEHPIEGGPS